MVTPVVICEAFFGLPEFRPVSAPDDDRERLIRIRAVEIRKCRRAAFGLQILRRHDGWGNPKGSLQKAVE
jgi:hypothetical protein